MKVRAQRRDQAGEVGEGARPAAKKQEGGRLGVIDALVHEVQVRAVDLRLKLGKLVELCLAGWPVERTPARREVARYVQRQALTPADTLLLIRPAGSVQAGMEVVEVVLRYGETEGPDVMCGHVDRIRHIAVYFGHLCAREFPVLVLSTSTRILELLALLSLRQEWTGAELADRLGVGLRTVRRDIDRLRALGYPVDSSRGVAGGYRLRAGADLPPLLLDDDEAITVAVALRTAASGGVLGLEEPAVVALAKLERVLPSRLRRRIAVLAGATTSIASPSADAVDARLLVTLANAVRDRTGLRLAYRDSRGRRSRRRVEPYRLVHTGRRWYLLAYDLDRDAWRTLRIDRIERKLTIDRRFHPRSPPADDLRAYVAGQISRAPYSHRVQVRVAAPAHEIAQRMPPTAASVTAVDAESSVVQTGADDLAVLCAWLGALDTPFHLEQATPGVRPQLARTAARLNAAAAFQTGARPSD